MSGTVSYIYTAPPFEGVSGTLLRSTDGAWIPCDLNNKDYQEFLTAIAGGMAAPSGWTGPTNPGAAT